MNHSNFVVDLAASPCPLQRVCSTDIQDTGSIEDASFGSCTDANRKPKLGYIHALASHHLDLRIKLKYLSFELEDNSKVMHDFSSNQSVTYLAFPCSEASNLFIVNCLKGVDMFL